MIKKAAIFGFLLIALMLSCGWANAECIVIVNKSVTETSLAGRDIKLVFLGKKIKWSDGRKIHKAGLVNGAVHEEFLKKFVRKNPYSYSSFWKLMIVTGGGIPPKSFKTGKEVVKYVAGREGAIGYISPKTPHNGVNVLHVE